MNHKKHYKRLMQFLPNAPKFQVLPDTKLILISDLHIANRKGNDDFRCQLELALPIFVRLVDQGYKFVLDGDITELLECNLREVHEAYKDLLELIFGNLAVAMTEDGIREIIIHHNHDAELVKQIYEHDYLANWFNSICDKPYFCRVAKLGNRAYITHGDLGTVNDDNNHWFIKPIVWVWGWLQRKFGVEQQARDKKSPAKNGELIDPLEKSYHYACRETGMIGVYGHTHLAKLDGMYVNLGCMTHKDYITYGIVENCKLSVKRTDRAGTITLGTVTLAG